MTDAWTININFCIFFLIFEMLHNIAFLIIYFSIKSDMCFMLK